MMSKNKKGLEAGGYAEKWSENGVTLKRGRGGGGY